MGKILDQDKVCSLYELSWDNIAHSNTFTLFDQTIVAYKIDL